MFKKNYFAGEIHSLKQNQAGGYSFMETQSYNSQFLPIYQHIGTMAVLTTKASISSINCLL